MSVSETSNVYSRPDAEFVRPSGEIFDGVIYGTKFSAEPGSAQTIVTFSIPTLTSTYSSHPSLGYGPDEEPNVDFRPIGDEEERIFRDALAEIEMLTNLQFVEVDDRGTYAGTIRIAWTGIDAEENVAWAYLPASAHASGDIWLLSQNLDPTDDYIRSTIIHELGHAVGLKHPHEAEDGFGKLDSDFDGNDYTIMSYEVSARYPEATWTSIEPNGFMYMDILALQSLYGVNPNGVNAGNTVHTFDTGETHYQTLWDTSGIDTLGVTGSKNVTLNLMPGNWQDVGTVIEYWDGTREWEDSFSVYVPPEVILENAFGGAGNDRISGNALANKLEGNDGADRLHGLAGDDRLLGGAGDDDLNGDSGDDTLVGGAGSDYADGGEGDDTFFAGADDVSADLYVGGRGNDKIGGGDGNDFLVGGVAEDVGAIDDGRDLLFGGNGDDTLLGGSWNDDAVSNNGVFDFGEENPLTRGGNTIWAGSGDDLVIGDASNDILGGGLGHDEMHGGGGADVLYAGTSTGADTLFGEGGNDTLFGGAGDDRLWGGNGEDLIYNGAGNDHVIGGYGNDTLWGGGGNDTLAGSGGQDVFAFSASTGVDVVEDFTVSEDILDLSETALASVPDFSSIAVQTDTGLFVDLGGGNSILLLGLTSTDIDTMTIVFS
ncbi:serralysin [Kordiimonas sediminis]|uniref:Serralysin n=1 Tax=Kordiimonas sediminis TaxID=1735581 RepID=A0A919AUF2_9PROT|nr:M10 family metallopeptidase [Kordiimonas sediminis]GHF25570.1 serralysin [Kordiimonas sediminis]